MIAMLAAGPTLCDRLAGVVRRDDADGAAFRRVMAALSDVLVPDVRLAPSPAIPAADDANLRAMFSGLEGASVYAVYRPGPLWQLSLIEGTLECQLDGFGRAGADGTLTGVATPPPHADLCWTSSRQLGTFSGSQR